MDAEAVIASLQMGAGRIPAISQAWDWGSSVGKFRLDRSA